MLSEEGYEDITNIDFSHKVISVKEEKYQQKYPKMTFKVMDALNMKEFQTGTFNAVIDKGTLDSILCGENSAKNAKKMISEVFRVLVPGGHYICITFGDPQHRKKHFETQQWGNLAVDKVLKPSPENSSNSNPDENEIKEYHYIYTMTKAHHFFY